MMPDTQSFVKSLNGLTQDSRAVKSGYLFAAFPGEKSDGRDYIDAAIKNGASHILLQDENSSPHDEARAPHDGIKFIYVQNPRKTFAYMVAQFYDAQPNRIVAVTGTNGKTSIVHFTKQIWTALGLNAAALGTLQGTMTTADPVTLHENLRALSDDGITHLALEASSHGLHQYRLDGVNITAAGFTNLSRDHLDYHETMADYLTAKSRLFTELLAENGIAIINADTDEGQTLIKQSKSAGHKVMTYGRAGDALKILTLTPTAQGQKACFEVFGKTYTLTIPLVGDFQIMNALCALGLVLAEQGIDQDKAVSALQTLSGALGRLQHVAGHPKDADIYIDYAHTPDALEHVLTALRPHTGGKLICLFGCGGDRDTGKRPVMGEIAARLSDTVIVTDDNPRGEDPAAIRAAIMKTAKSAEEIADRRAAIKTAISKLDKNDVLLIAGKGHEQGQILATHTEPFDDVTEAKQVLKNL